MNAPFASFAIRGICEEQVKRLLMPSFILKHCLSPLLWICNASNILAPSLRSKHLSRLFFKWRECTRKAWIRYLMNCISPWSIENVSDHWNVLYTFIYLEHFALIISRCLYLDAFCAKIAKVCDSLVKSFFNSRPLWTKCIILAVHMNLNDLTVLNVVWFVSL